MGLGFGEDGKKITRVEEALFIRGWENHFDKEHSLKFASIFPFIFHSC